MIQGNHLNTSGKISASVYSDISSSGRRSGGAKPRERRLLLLFNTWSSSTTRYTPPPPKGAQAAVHELVLLMIQGNHLNTSGKIPAPVYSDISSSGRRSGGAKPRERHVTLILYDSFLIIWEKQDDSAAPEGRPGGGSGTCSVDFPQKFLHPTVQAYPFGGGTAAGRSPGSVYRLFYRFFIE